MKPFGDYSVYLVKERKSAGRPAMTYKVQKSGEGTLGEDKGEKIVVKPTEVNKNEGIERLEETKGVSQGADSKMKETEEIKVAQAVENKKSSESSEDKEEVKKEDSIIQGKEIEVEKKEGHEAKELPLVSTTLPEKDRVTSLETVTDEKIVPSVEMKEETMYLESVEKVVVTEKKEGHEIAAKKEEVPEKVAEAKKPSEASDVGKVSKKDASSGKGKKKKVAKAEKLGSKGSLKSEAKKNASAISKEKTSKDIYDVKKFEEAVSHTISALAKTEGGISPETKAGDHVEPSADGVKGETLHIKDEAGSIAEIAASEKGVMPSEEDSFSKKEEIKQQPIVKIEPEAKEEKKPPFGIPVSDVLLAKDIKIEIFFHDTEISNVKSLLLKKAHPMAHKKDDSEKPKEVDGLEQKNETYIEGTPGVKRSFSVSKAEKGMYIFVIENKEGKTYEADVVFRLFEGKAGERIKEIKPVELSPHAIVKFKFILPETVFWDDEYYFTGTIESSDTLTKFNHKTGLIWKEEKDY